MPLDVLKYGHPDRPHRSRRPARRRLATPNVCGVWSVREIIAHLASFEYALVEALSVARGGPVGPTWATCCATGRPTTTSRWRPAPDCRRPKRWPNMNPFRPRRWS